MSLHLGRDESVRTDGGVQDRRVYWMARCWDEAMRLLNKGL